MPEMDPKSNNARHRKRVKPSDLDAVRAGFESIQDSSEVPEVYLPSADEIRVCASSIRANRLQKKQQADPWDNVHDQVIHPCPVAMSPEQYELVIERAREAKAATLARYRKAKR